MNGGDVKNAREREERWTKENEWMEGEEDSKTGKRWMRLKNVKSKLTGRKKS